MIGDLFLYMIDKICCFGETFYKVLEWLDQQTCIHDYDCRSFNIGVQTFQIKTCKKCKRKKID